VSEYKLKITDTNIEVEHLDDVAQLSIHTDNTPFMVKMSTGPSPTVVFTQGVANPDALLIQNRLSELNTAQAKIDARNNLELQVIDLGTFN